MTNHLLKGLLLIAVSSLSLHAKPLANHVIGYAYDTRTNELIYTEEHDICNDYHQVNYFTLNHDLFASKKLRYGSVRYQPSFVMFNKWAKENQMISWLDGSTLTGSYQNKLKGIKRENKDIDFNSTPPLVIDSGFDAFIDQHWDTLKAGNKKNIQYLIPTRLSTLTLSIKKESETQDTITFKIYPKSLVYRILTNSINVTYNMSQQLLSFSGTSNIADQEGFFLPVTIHYKVNPRQESNQAACNFHSPPNNSLTNNPQ